MGDLKSFDHTLLISACALLPINADDMEQILVLPLANSTWKNTHDW